MGCFGDGWDRYAHGVLPEHQAVRVYAYPDGAFPSSFGLAAEGPGGLAGPALPPPPPAAATQLSVGAVNVGDSDIPPDVCVLAQIKERVFRSISLINFEFDETIAVAVPVADSTCVQHVSSRTSLWYTTYERQRDRGIILSYN